MRNPKEILEKIDAAETRRRELAVMAKAAGEANSDREFWRLDAEISRLTEQIDDLNDELEESQRDARQIAAMSAATRGESIFMTDFKSGRPERILDNHGEPSPRYTNHRRIAPLRAFTDTTLAYDSGVWLRALAARECGQPDSRSERHCERVGLELTTAAGEATGVGGGYLVPAPIANTVIEVRERVGIARQLCNVQPTPGNTLTIPKRAGGLTVYYPDEAETIADSTKNWGQVACTLRKRAVATVISNELVEDALISVADNAVMEMGYALALQEDNELINGTGSSSFGTVNGLLNKIGAGGVYTASTNDHDDWASLDMSDFTATVAKLPDRFHSYSPAWICSHAFFHSTMARLAVSAGGVTASEVLGGVGARSFLGYPVYTTSHMPTSSAASQKCALFGAFNQAVVLADKGGIRVARSDDYKFLEDQIALRATARYDINVHEPGTSTTAGAYVALETNS